MTNTFKVFTTTKTQHYVDYEFVDKCANTLRRAWFLRADISGGTCSATLRRASTDLGEFGPSIKLPDKLKRHLMALVGMWEEAK